MYILRRIHGAALFLALLIISVAFETLPSIEVLRHRDLQGRSLRKRTWLATPVVVVVPKRIYKI